MTAIMPAPTYNLARAAWIATLVIWHGAGRFTRLEGGPCDEYAAALTASWWLRPTSTTSTWSPHHSTHVATLQACH